MSDSPPRYLNVFLYGEHVAVVRPYSVGYTLELTDQGMKSAPISLAFQSDKRRYQDLSPKGVVSTFLYGLLPDDAAVRGTLAKELGVQPTAISMLSKMGLDCAGAVQFTPNDTLPERPRVLTPMSDSSIAEALRGSRLLKRGQPRPEGDPMRGRFSLAGFQTKFTLRLKDGKWFLPDGDEPSTHIVKPTIKSDDVPHQAFVEHVTMDVARRLGLPTANTEFRDFEGEECIIVERYDRFEIDGQLERIHQEDMCSALSIDPDDKYDVTASEIRSVIEKSGDPEADRLHVFEALAFNVLIGGGDAHAKNLSMTIAPDGNVRLAPLYDMASAFPYSDGMSLRDVRDRIAVPMDGRVRFSEIGEKEWSTLAADLGVEDSKARELVASLADRLPGALRDALSDSSVPKELSDWVHWTPWLPLVDSSADQAADEYGIIAPRRGPAAAPPYEKIDRSANAGLGAKCGKRVESTGMPCLLNAGHGGYCKSRL